jgi:hypothetical protein
VKVNDASNLVLFTGIPNFYVTEFLARSNLKTEFLKKSQYPNTTCIFRDPSDVGINIAKIDTYSLICHFNILFWVFSSLRPQFCNMK